MRAWLTALIVVTGCSRPSEPPAPGPAAGSAAGSNVVPVPIDAAPAAVAPDAAVDDPAARAAYRAGMRKGRKATDAKRWAEAIAGFDAALAAKPNDARALGERGFARLREGTDLAAATRDLDRAASLTKQPKLLSEIWFNRGLVHEKRGEPEAAIAAFSIANVLRPTKAAAAKLAGKQACPAQIDRTFAIPDHPVLDAADWRALAKAIAPDADEPPTSTEAALDALTGSPTAPALPVVIHTGSASVEYVDYVVLARKGGLRAIPVANATGGRCAGELAFELQPTDGRYLHVRGTELFDGGYTYMCEDKEGELYECTGAEDEVSAGTACVGGSPTERDLVIDPVAGTVVLVVEQVDAAGGLDIALDGTTLTVRGRGCDRRIAL